LRAPFEGHLGARQQAAAFTQAVEGTSLDQVLECAAVQAGDAFAEVEQVAVGPVAGAFGDYLVDHAFTDVADSVQAEAHVRTHGGEVGAGFVDVGRQHFHAQAAGVIYILGNLVRVAALDGEEGSSELDRVVSLQVG